MSFAVSLVHVLECSPRTTSRGMRRRWKRAYHTSGGAVQDRGLSLLRIARAHVTRGIICSAALYVVKQEWLLPTIEDAC